jgi:flagellar motor protein MotB
MSRSAKNRKGPVEEHQKVPGWIVSFTDMITLLLAFFVLLQAFARTRDPELFYQGQGSFLRAIKGFGLPAWLTGSKYRPKRQYSRVTHPTKEADNRIPHNQVLDAEDEDIRQIFHVLRRAIETQSSDLPKRPMETVVTPIRFEPGRAQLNAQASDWIARFASDLTEARTPKNTSIDVMGRAPDAPMPRRQWLISAVRAKAVADALRASLASTAAAGPWEIDSFGSGSTGSLWRQPEEVTRRSFIVIRITGTR